MSSRACHASRAQQSPAEALLLAHRLRVSGRWRPPPPDNLGKVLPSRRRVAWRLRGLGGGSVASAWPQMAWLAWLMSGRQASPRGSLGSRYKAPANAPRGQAGPKRARGTPQNKAMVRPNPINRPRSTQCYPGSSKHPHWLGFSGVAQATGFCGLWIRLLAQGSWNA